jgi:hypothetical protein
VIHRLACSSVEHAASSLDRTKPLPTLIDAPRPLHTLLGFTPQQSILSLSLRDPADGREMPPNMNDTVTAHCLRGVRKVRSRSRSFHVYKL